MQRTQFALWLGLGLCLLIPAASASAAGWPDNWLGNPDNSYMALHIGVHFYGCVLHDLPDEQGASPLPKAAADAMTELTAMPEAALALQQQEYTLVQSQLEETARFYWRNSRFNCALEFEYMPDFTPRLRSSIAASDAPYYSPVDQSVYGDERSKFDGLLQICVMYHYNKDTGKLERYRGGGGFTWGCDGPKHLCGWSWWAAPPADNACGSDWLLCHEFGHELDSLFYASGHPEHWFNHLAESEANLARFGEHFDCMAYILRRTKEADWLDLKWGTRREFADADGDHAPDSDDWLAARGFETDPSSQRVDTDGDGMSDHDEMLCGNGNWKGHGERLYYGIGYCIPTNPDSDGDGIADGLDEYPYVPLKGNIHAAAPGASWMEAVETHPDDEAPSPTGNEPAIIEPRIHYDWLPMAYDYEPQMRCELQYQQDHALHLRVLWADPMEVEPWKNNQPSESTLSPCELRLTFDFDNDGWFTGNDNYRLKLDEKGVESVLRNVCYSTTEGPTEKTDAVDISKIPCKVLTDVEGYAHGLDLTLPHALFPELAAKAGEEFGFNLGIRHKPQDPKSSAWFYMIYDPNALMPLELR